MAIPPLDYFVRDFWILVTSRTCWPWGSSTPTRIEPLHKWGRKAAFRVFHRIQGRAGTSALGGGRLATTPGRSIQEYPPACGYSTLCGEETGQVLSQMADAADFLASVGSPATKTSRGQTFVGFPFTSEDDRIVERFHIGFHSFRAGKPL